MSGKRANKSTPKAVGRKAKVNDKGQIFLKDARVWALAQETWTLSWELLISTWTVNVFTPDNLTLESGNTPQFAYWGIAEDRKYQEGISIQVKQKAEW